MTDDKPGRGDKPDPFAPLPLADLPPVRRRGEASGPTPTAEPAPRPRTPTGGLPPTAFVPREETPSIEQAWTDPRGPEPVIAADVSAPLDPIAGQAWTAPDPSDAQAWTEAPVAAAPVAEPPLLPATYSENELREAVGATPRPEPTKKAKRRAPTPPPVDDDDGDDDRPAKKRNRRTVVVGALSILVGSSIAALVFLGKANSAKYMIACEAERVVVEQGRSFPPWGASTLDGAEWKALKIPPEAACHPRETEDQAELAGWYLKILVDQATVLLTARSVTTVDDAEAALKQALLVSRALKTEDDAKNARGDIDRLLGDVVYWRASARLRSASDTLADAAKQFDAAAAQRPAHFTDAAAWAGYARKLMDQLRAGPGGAAEPTFPPLPPSERPTAPPGTALPVESDRGSGAGSSPPAPPVAAPDAGVPTGGVLL